MKPVSQKVYSPISGVVETAFPTGHAFGIRSDSGVEVLIHIGIDTVSLNGKGFTAKVKQGERINAKDLLAEVDLELVNKEGYPLTTMVIMTSHAPFETLVNTDDNIVAKSKVLELK